MAGLVGITKLIREKHDGVTFETVQFLVLQSNGPVHQATHAPTTRFHDDKEAYTGTHKTDGRHGVIPQGKVVKKADWA